MKMETKQTTMADKFWGHSKFLNKICAFFNKIKIIQNLPQDYEVQPTLHISIKKFYDELKEQVACILLSGTLKSNSKAPTERLHRNKSLRIFP